MTATSPQGLRARADAMVARTQQRLAANPGDRSALRRALRRTPEDIHSRRAHAVVAPFVHPGDSPAAERAFYAVAAMMAAQPRTARDTDTDTDTDETVVVEQTRGQRETLGITLGRAVGVGILNPATTEDRLHLLCRQPVDGVHRHLPRLIMHVRAELVPVDWSQLLVDLAYWPQHRDGIVKRWLQDYYRKLDAIERAKKNPTTNPNSDSESDAS